MSDIILANRFDYSLVVMQGAPKKGEGSAGLLPDDYEFDNYPDLVAMQPVM